MGQECLVIIGGGIVGLAAAYQAQRAGRGAHVVVIEKEPAVGSHQSGRNSGVIHSGIYYKPGSLKALNCRRGKAMLETFCAAHDIPFETCGKVIVATREQELSTLARIEERGGANGVPCERIDGGRLRELEPHAAGIAALLVPDAGIVDYPAVCRRLAALIAQAGGEVRTGSAVVGLHRERTGVLVECESGEIAAHTVVNCAGLHSDRVTRMGGVRPPARIIPFRGEYYELRPEAAHLCRNLIYPVPDSRFPFLGVHFTRMIGGGVECGPNAVLALAREGYSWSEIDVEDLADTLGYPAFWRIAARYWRTGAGEIYRSLSKRAFTRALQRLIPEIREDHLVRGGAGVRAQALSPRGELVDDFLIARDERVINVCNAPSPAATSALAIGETIAGMLG